jgi:hypothetical protein
MRLPNQSTGIRRCMSTDSAFKKSVYPARVAQFNNPFNPGRLYFCYGWNEDTHSCSLYLGSKQLCDSLTPCNWGPSQAPVSQQVVRIGGHGPSTQRILLRPGVCYDDAVGTYYCWRFLL